jgi:hypothetical protein
MEVAMSEDAVSYPADAGATAFMLTVRGKTTQASVEDARRLHNATAGAPPSVAAARSLGDLSHNVYTGSRGSGDGEVLFVDFWNSQSGLGRFFSDPQVQAAADRLFTSRDPVVWAPAAEFGEVSLTVPSGRAVAGVGLLRTTVTSLEKAASAFGAYLAATVNQARRHGLVAHRVLTRVPNPGEQSAPEILAVDLWMDAAEMDRYYELGVGFDLLAPVQAGQPDTSTWESAPGDWVEW